ncbi:acid phosphatase pho5 [Monascus purpureus]|nr:acid phosphatase pho5 [Monascus purpureus]BDD62639.1 hypothetical protein MAP00_007601 [Monascus purpureus]
MQLIFTVAAIASVAAGFQSVISEKQFSQEFLDNYSILKHYGGNGPYSSRRSYGISREPPDSCSVDQVIMIMRHGERYPSPDLGASIEAALAKIKSSNVSTYQGDLDFLNSWTYYVPNHCAYNAETSTGPYAGLLEGFKRGSDYRARYGHLWDGESIVPIFAAGYQRIIATSRKFGEGFFGANYSTNAAINIISEAKEMGANSLTPTCDHDNDTSTCNSLTTVWPQFKVAAARLNSQNPGLDLNATDIYYLMSMASFELNARPYSDWINVFTLDEWVTFGYVQDLNYYYCAGPGDKNMAAVGAVYVNASLTLLNQGPSAGTLWFNFAHDTNITPILAALGVLTPERDLPTDRVVFDSKWSSGDIVPQAGHLTIERLNCTSTAASPAGVYVRLVQNEAVIPVEACQSGPGYSCSLADFTEIMSKQLPDFVSTCSIRSSYPQYLDFWWNYNTTTDLNYPKGPVPCAEGVATS